jgi:lysozyme family protein
VSSLKYDTINHIIKIEGGYVNDPDDSGGETNFGVTEKVARDNGYIGKMIDMPQEFAYNLYQKRYWDAICLDEISALSEKVAIELADTSVNMGAGRAAEFLQRSLNAFNKQSSLYKDVIVDMDVGPATIKALTKYLELRGADGEKVLYTCLNSLQGAFYVTLTETRQKDEKYSYGWFLNRVV